MLQIIQGYLFGWQTVLGVAFGVAVSVFFIAQKRYAAALESSTDRARLIAEIESRHWPERYRAWVEWPLNRLDQAFGPAAWSVKSFDVLLLLAVAYPILSLILQWGLFQGSGQIGFNKVLDDSVPWEWRLILLGLMAVGFMSGARMALSVVSDRYIQATAAFALGALIFLIVIAFAGTGILAGMVVYVGPGAFTCALAIAAGALGFLAISFMQERHLVGILAAILAFLTGSSSAIPPFILDAIPEIIPYVSIPGGLVGTAAFLIPLTALNIGIARNRLSCAYVFSILFLFLTLWLTMRFTDYGETTSDRWNFIAFLCFLPIVNATFDWLSLGITRLCLRRGIQPSGWPMLWWGFADLGAAFLTFLGLGFALITLLVLFQEGNGAHLVDLEFLFLDIAAEPQRYWWLYVTLFSTFLPTFAHLLIAATSWITLFPDQYFARTLHLLRDVGDDGKMIPRSAQDAAFRYALFFAASVGGTIVVLGQLGLWAFTYHGHVGDFFYGIFHGFARMIGAVAS